MSTISRAARLGLLSCSFAALAACGGGGGGGSTPPPPAQAPAAAVTAFTPADAATQVDVQSALKIIFDSSLAPASVDRTHVTLFAQGVPVATKVSYDDATRTITVDPMGLTYGLTYTLAVSGLVDAKGSVVADRKAMFSTWVNGETYGVELFVHTGVFPAVSTTALVDALDSSGRVSGQNQADSAGADGLWSTADDVLEYYVRQTHTADGQLASESGFSAGPDGLMFTADDIESIDQTRTYSLTGAPLTAHNLAQESPLRPGTFVDEVFTTYAYAENGTVFSEVTSVDKGPDGVWGTADDTIGWAEFFTYDSMGRVVLDSYSWQPGPDGHWGTADDVIAPYTLHLYRSDGRLDRLEYRRAGADGIPSTADDTLSAFDLYSYDAAGNVSQIIQTGPDQAPPGGLYSTTTYDSHNNRIAHKFFDFEGPDGTWFTADDRQAITRLYDPSH
jgi:hypothetical protein